MIKLKLNIGMTILAAVGKKEQSEGGSKGHCWVGKLMQEKGEGGPELKQWNWEQKRGLESKDIGWTW